jgi:hypothetical protein
MQDASLQLARMMLSVPRPETLARVETKKIIAFHGKYDAERVKFAKRWRKW